MKPIEPATATAAPTPSATPTTTISRGAVDVDAERGGGVLAERQRAEGAHVERSSSQLATKNGAAIDR